jgi:protein-serine/threonine kinase
MHFGGPPWHSAKPEQPAYQKFLKGWEKWSIDHPDGEITNTDGGWPKCGELFAFLDPPPLRRLLLKMLNPNPERRISIHDALSKAPVKSASCCTPEGIDEDGACCGPIDAAKGGVKPKVRTAVLPRHNHLPPKEHKTPKAFQHRFDMGDGWN